jgi:hypothetical protein
MEISFMLFCVILGDFYMCNIYFVLYCTVYTFTCISFT